MIKFIKKNMKLKIAILVIAILIACILFISYKIKQPGFTLVALCGNRDLIFLLLLNSQARISKMKKESKYQVLLPAFAVVDIVIFR